MKMGKGSKLRDFGSLVFLVTINMIKNRLIEKEFIILFPRMIIAIGT